MRSTALFAALALALAPCVFGAPTKDTSPSFVDIPEKFTKGFKNASIQSSSGGKAICISGMLDITASANNVRVNLEEPTNQTVVTELIVEQLQVDSTLAERLAGGMSPVSGTYGIYSQLCFPNGGINTTTIQFLVHGAGFDRSYWNVAPDYSYVDFAAEQGYATFLYDRLGTGLSDHPDPIQTVQFGIHTEIAHQLIELLRTGGISSSTFERVVGVGHSYGSFLIVRVANFHPTDFDAVVLTGFSSTMGGMDVARATLDLTITSENQPLRFSELPNGYVTAASIEGVQTFFFRAPGFDPAMLSLAEASKQTFALGEALPLYKPEPAANFTGPIDVVNGVNDLPNCYGNCLYPNNSAAGVKDLYFPAAKNSSFYLAPNTGHALNLHYTANTAYGHIHDFLKENGF